MTTETFDKAKEEVLKKVENIHHIYAPPPTPALTKGWYIGILPVRQSVHMSG